MMNFIHHSRVPLKILKCEGIKHCVMKMGEETIKGVCNMFTVWSQLIFALWYINYQHSTLRERSPFHLMCGHQAINMPSWLSLHTMWPMTENLLHCLYYLFWSHIYTLLQRSSWSTFENWSGSIQGRIWLRPFGWQWNYMVWYVSWPQFFNLSSDVFTDHCHCDGQCEQQ